jgi:TRAP-type mannitol/chloroaromatic compound transport system permease small subunit
MEKVLRWIDKLSEWSGKAASFLIIPLILFICYDVFMRYVLSKPTDWAGELSTYVFGTMWLIGGAYALLTRSHVQMEIFYNRFSPRSRKIIDVSVAPFFFLFIGVLFWQGLNLAIASWAKMEHSWTMWSPPIYLPKTMIPLGAFLILLQGLAIFIRNILNLVQGEQKS